MQFEMNMHRPASLRLKKALSRRNLDIGAPRLQQVATLATFLRE